MEEPERKSRGCSKWETVVCLNGYSQRRAAPVLPEQLIHVLALTWMEGLDPRHTPPFWRLCLFTNTSWLIMLIDCHKKHKVKAYQCPLENNKHIILLQFLCRSSFSVYCYRFFLYCSWYSTLNKVNRNFAIKFSVCNKLVFGKYILLVLIITLLLIDLYWTSLSLSYEWMYCTLLFLLLHFYFSQTPDIWIIYSAKESQAWSIIHWCLTREVSQLLESESHTTW